MLKTICLALLLTFPAAAQEERLNWQPLEVTAVEDDEKPVSSVESDGRFKNLMSELNESVTMAAAKKSARSRPSISKPSIPPLSK